MNYLAHLFLSGSDEQIIVGNFMGDYVKGKEYKNFPEGIQTGILLHREIDSFTDSHSNCHDAKRLFRKEFGLYSGIVVDFIYDHVLARNWVEYSPFELKHFASHIHSVLTAHSHFFPSKVQGFLPFLIQHKRLESYATEEGIAHSMLIMSKYSSFPDKGAVAMAIFRENANYLTSNFSNFMAEIITHIETRYRIFPKNRAF